MTCESQEQPISVDSALLISKILHLQILKEILDLPLKSIISLSWLATPGRSSHFSLRHSASLLPHAAATCSDGSQVGASPASCLKEAYIYFTVSSKSSERDMERGRPNGRNTNYWTAARARSSSASGSMCWCVLSHRRSGRLHCRRHDGGPRMANM